MALIDSLIKNSKLLSKFSLLYLFVFLIVLLLHYFLYFIYLSFLLYYFPLKKVIENNKN